jgi:glycosyltransferase involved in cell wall biosynthesis
VRVLILHSRYLSGDASGENRVVEDEARLLEKAGHNVHVWQPSPEQGSIAALVRSATDAVWSKPAVSRVRRLMEEHQPEIAHCHNLIPSLSPAIIRTLRSLGVPVVMTLHNYRFMCLPSTFLRDDRICEDCLGHIPWRGVYHRCWRNSALGSGVMASTFTLHRAIGTFQKMNLYLAVSRFVREKYIQGGFDESAIRVKPNFTWPSPEREGPGDYFLFAGRLSAEKGVEPLIRGWHDAIGRLVIAGDGPQATELRSIAPASVEFRGLVPADRMPSMLRNARALLLPSLWYEAQPRIILEAYASGVPVIASDIGGLPELVRHEVTGYLVPPGDSDGWAAAAGRMSDDHETMRLGSNARELWKEAYGPDKGLENLEAAYAAARDAR